MQRPFIIKLACFLCISFFLFSCAGIDEEPVTLLWKVGDKHKHIGFSYWVYVPNLYRKADSYKGYQANNYASSIVIEEQYENLDQIIDRYSDENFQKKRFTLFERKLTMYNGETKGLFVKYKFKQDVKTVMILFFEDGGNVYKLESFYLDNLVDTYENEIRRCLLSVVKAEDVQNDNELQVAKILDGFSGLIYSRDGKFPTESPDDLIVEEREILNVKAVNPDKLIAQEIKKLQE